MRHLFGAEGLRRSKMQPVLPKIIDRHQVSITTERQDVVYRQMWDRV